MEQFQPEVNSEFHGQEKLAEALKEKQPAKKPEQAGKIAKVIRPGYRYVIDDENYQGRQNGASEALRLRADGGPARARLRPDALSSVMVRRRES